jgi:ATP-binding protein involved in chromosome partitioning
MGPVTFRTYRDVTGDDRSGLLEQVLDQRRRVRARMIEVRHVVAVVSGKGGVGKSHVTAGLSAALASRAGVGIGVLDADLESPTVAGLLDAHGPVLSDADAVHPVVGRSGVRVFSMDLLLAEGQPMRWRSEGSEAFVWRGTLEAGALREFLADVAWGALDLLLVDQPPGTDRLADLKALVPNLAGAIAVTIPTEESRRSVARAIRSVQTADVRVLGIVENMSGYACAECDSLGPLFPGDAGAALAREFGLPLLARLPFAPAAGGWSPEPLFDRLAERLTEVLA